MDHASLADRLLDVIEQDLAALTRRRITEKGDKVFGAAILRKSDLSLVVAETNNETESPLWHGEMNAIRRFYELPRTERPDPRDCLFLATHEPCSLCLSGITWSGFDNFYYLFSYEETRDVFAIPHDIRILREVYAVADPDREAPAPRRDYYNRSNAFFQSHGLTTIIAGLDRGTKERLVERVDNLTALYAELSAFYQATKAQSGILLS
ncbi:MAG: nucleoside deaminase [Devosia sp.]